MWTNVPEIGVHVKMDIAEIYQELMNVFVTEVILIGMEDVRVGIMSFCKSY